MELQTMQQGDEFMPEVSLDRFGMLTGGLTAAGSMKAGVPHTPEWTSNYIDNTERIAIVDGSNIAYARGVPSLDNVKKVDEYLQSRGFRRENIVFIFDSSFRYRVGREEFDRYAFSDERVSVSPAREQADRHILEFACENASLQDETMPLIVSNDRYEDHFRQYPLLSFLKDQRRGVTWVNFRGENRPVMSIDQWSVRSSDGPRR